MTTLDALFLRLFRLIVLMKTSLDGKRQREREREREIQRYADD
jgi:hypothetical protein